MAELARWNEHIFEVSPTVLRSFTNLSVKGSAETEDVTKSKEKYVKYKNNNPIELNLTVNLYAQLGIEDVRAEAMQYVQEASDGAEDFFYVGDQKLVEQMMMLTSAQIDKVVMTNTGVWTQCDVKLNFKASTKEDGEKSGGGSGYINYSGGGSSSSKKKKATTKTTPTTTKTTGTKQTVSGLKDKADSALNTVKDFLTSVGATVTTAQKVSAAFKKNGGTKAPSSTLSSKISTKAHS